MNDPVWGIAPPECVYNRDQVPIALCANTEKTVDDKGREVVVDSLTKESDAKRFATLDLTIAMEPKEDLSNVPKPHTIFRGKTQKGSNWADKDEIEQWDNGVVVSFQENAWIDQTTCRAKEAGHTAQRFQDNCSTHVTREASDCWEKNVKGFAKERFYPANCALCVQAIDRHVGRCYQRAVHRALHKEMTKRLHKCLQEGTEFTPLSAREKRILITKAIGEHHRMLCRDKPEFFFRAFEATATWMPVYHFHDEIPESLKNEETRESNVQVQHLVNYDHAKVCSKEAIAELQQQREEEAKKIAAEKALRREQAK